MDIIFTPKFHSNAEALNQVRFLEIYPAIKDQLTIDADALAAAATQPISAPGNTPDQPFGIIIGHFGWDNDVAPVVLVLL